MTDANMDVNVTQAVVQSPPVDLSNAGNWLSSNLSTGLNSVIARVNSDVFVLAGFALVAFLVYTALSSAGVHWALAGVLALLLALVLLGWLAPMVGG